MLRQVWVSLTILDLKKNWGPGKFDTFLGFEKANLRRHDCTSTVVLVSINKQNNLSKNVKTKTKISYGEIG